MLKQMIAAATLIAAAMTTVGVANAQSDPSIRNDLRTGLTLPNIEPAGGTRTAWMVSEAGAEQPSRWTFNFEVGESYTDNAGFEPDDGESSFFFAPTAQAVYKHPRIFGEWTFRSSATATASYYDEDSVYDEGVAIIDFQLAHAFHEGVISIFQRTTASFDGDFDDQGGSSRDYGVGYAQDFGANDQTTLQALVYYQDASRNRDRVVVRADLSHGFGQGAFGAEWGIGQRLQYSNYQDDARDDALFSRTGVTATWKGAVAGGDLSVVASYTHNFTDGDDVDAFEIGPVLAWSF